MQTALLEAKKRNSLGKNDAKKIRLEGFIPGVIYGEKQEPLHILFSEREVEKIYRISNNKNTLIVLKIDSDGTMLEETVLARDISKDALTQRFIHVDFIRIDVKKPIRTVVKIKFSGICPGVKMGGVLMHNLSSLKIFSLPREVPDFIDISLASLELGKNIRVRDLNLGEGIQILNGPEETIVHVETPKGYDEESAKAADGATPAATPAAAPAKK